MCVFLFFIFFIAVVVLVVPWLKNRFLLSLGQGPDSDVIAPLPWSPRTWILVCWAFSWGNACCFFAHVLLWPNNDRFHLTLAAKAKTPPLSQLASLPLNPNTRHPTRQGIFFLFLFSERLMLLLLRMEKSFSFVQGRSSGVPRLLTLEVKGVKRAACECVGGWMGGCHCSPPVPLSAVSFSRSPWARALFTSVEVLRRPFLWVDGPGGVLLRHATAGPSARKLSGPKQVETTR